MGCKCTNENEEEEIKNDGSEKCNIENFEKDANRKTNQNEDLLAFNNQANIYQEQISNNEATQYQYLNNENEKLKEEEKGNNIDNYNYDPNVKFADYPEKIVELINNIREDPVGYADVVEDSIKNIIEEEDKNDPNNIRLIYKKKVKVALNRGKPAFIEAAEQLRSLKPLPPLEFRHEKCIPLPENEEELKDSSFLREQVKQLREETQIDVFFKDLIKVPSVSGLLMIVDDANKNPGKKRMAILNKDLKYIGVTSKFIGKTFIAYFSFSKE